jgi:stress-induced morphogen
MVMELQEIRTELTAALQKIIDERHLHPTRFEVELSPYGAVEIYMTAPEFSGKTDRQRELMIMAPLEKRLKREVIMHISVLMLWTPEEDPEFEKLHAA